MNPTATTRRHFLHTATAAGLVTAAVPVFGQNPGAGAKKLKLGLIGCGGRGSQAVENHLEAAKSLGLEVEVAAVADPQEGRAKDQAKRYQIPAERAFFGFDGYRKLLESGVDLVILATPPNFRPVHFEAAVRAGKHVFTEKPVAVDPPGIRRFIAAAAEATKKGLSVVAGTQRRHEWKYVRQAQAIKDGAVGKILGGTIHWCQNQLWFKKRNPGESDAMYLARNWVNWTEMSGDHIVEQHVHNIDVACWFLGRPPQSANGFGSRERRVTGNQYDFFSVDYDFGEDIHIHSMCRQINNTWGRVGELFRGAEGVIQGGGKISSVEKLPESPRDWHDNPYVQEHVHLLQAITGDKPLNEGRQVAESCMAAIMGRMSAYTGQMIRWSEVMDQQNSPHFNLTLAPAADDFEKGDVKCPPEETAPLPGK
jgi:myo-inositol 2-dehydrogenase / D-chiro-inositol 1-dehydrogenase